MSTESRVQSPRTVAIVVDFRRSNGFYYQSGTKVSSGGGECGGRVHCPINNNMSILYLTSCIIHPVSIVCLHWTSQIPKSGQSIISLLPGRPASPSPEAQCFVYASKWSSVAARRADGQIDATKCVMRTPSQQRRFLQRKCQQEQDG